MAGAIITQVPSIRGAYCIERCPHEAIQGDLAVEADTEARMLKLTNVDAKG
jgi:hypothetical protein